MKSFPFYKQLDAMDCGPSCLRMIAKHYGKSYTLQYLRDISYIDREGVSLKGISEAAERIGFQPMAVKIPFSAQGEAPSLLVAPLPVIAHWKQNHFLVVYKANKKHVWVADPGAGKFRLPAQEFKAGWLSDGQKGVCLLLSPGGHFYQEEEDQSKPLGFAYLLQYLKPHRRLLSQLVIGLLLGSLFSLVFPFLTQSVVDIGIQNQNIGFIYLILIGHLVLFISQTAVRFIQNWILLHIGTRINISLINDFLSRLMRLPIGFFDTKMTGDLLQRIGDHRRIEVFLTQSALSVIFSVFNLVIFSFVLLYYSVTIFLIFAVAAALYMIWIAFFLRRRREIDYRAFQQMSDNQDTLIELVQGMQEIKLQDSQAKRRWRWAEIQAKLFKVQIKSLAITQYQDGGATFISQLKDIVITFIAAKAVIDGQITLGMMLAIQYILGQLNAPLTQLVGFVRSAQDARISLERLGEIQNQSPEDAEDNEKSTLIPKGDLALNGVYFRYNRLHDWTLADINLTIPRGKVTAIVGVSGSGKTTLLKLLLGFYQPEKGNISIGSAHLERIRPSVWRRQCGVVMQDGYIFSDNIANNIAESEKGYFGSYDIGKLQHSVHVANIRDYIEQLPLGYNTIIGARGNGISQGQRQRLLIGRAVYKDPEFLFFDEATNALDANNERVIMEQLNQFFQGRTVVVVAHRLSTVRHADKIVVIDQGKIVEEGCHDSLVTKGGAYYTLVKNQLELGN
ncbi:peptidase domain-containing ABC transporter [Phaeodactylibacter xiamenensis]|jgi:ATP-binding cassette subfamily B protein|uniref:peptidase domain-containing ABC transporter n=1 Tax=Phaeodactylibacter xiamenensis TaxID=1524460 RepID=UPI0024A88973|nr:peptidase domain-containing ABC transporter [Phaeodactylibacter xiamenensis]